MSKYKAPKEYTCHAHDVVDATKKAIKLYEEVYEELPGRHGKTWYVGSSKNYADHVYVHDPNKPGIKRDISIRQRGPGGPGKVKTDVHRGDIALLREEINLDFENAYLTKCTISQRGNSVSGTGLYKMFDIVHWERHGSIGPSNRCDDIAKEIATKKKTPVFMCSEGPNGSSSTWIQPD